MQQNAHHIEDTFSDDKVLLIIFRYYLAVLLLETFCFCDCCNNSWLEALSQCFMKTLAHSHVIYNSHIAHIIVVNGQSYNSIIAWIKWSNLPTTCPAVLFNPGAVSISGLLNGCI